MYRRLNMRKQKRLIPFALDRSEYENPLDRKLLNCLSALKPLNMIAKSIFAKWNMPRLQTVLLSQGIKVSDKQAKPIYNICRDCSEILSIEVPDIFIIQNPVLNAETYGDGKSNNFILLTSGLIDSISVDELYSVIGHEMGHIKSGHAFYHTVAIWIGLYTGACAEMLSSLKLGISGI